MPILRRKNDRDAGQPKEQGRKFIDLNDFKFAAETEDVDKTLRFAVVNDLEDLRKISDHIYEGNIVIMDCSSLSSDRLALRRITDEIKRMVKDTKGDAAMLNESYIAVTPPGIQIDRKKIQPY
ncbi:MAG TPA: cell division protein SepF [Thermoplasmataceae archaeon]|nr:cell division protein SepF [Thermoplasmatales archaeon AK]HLH86252.1 cell division protein SepF [Thermoplasmataceae archaeon]